MPFVYIPHALGQPAGAEEHITRYSRLSNAPYQKMFEYLQKRKKGRKSTLPCVEIHIVLAGASACGPCEIVGCPWQSGPGPPIDWAAQAEDMDGLKNRTRDNRHQATPDWNIDAITATWAFDTLTFHQFWSAHSSASILPYEPTAIASPVREPLPEFCRSRLFSLLRLYHIRFCFRGPCDPRPHDDVMGNCSSCLGNRRRDEYEEVRRNVRRLADAHS
jgi:hypothetical protein